MNGSQDLCSRRIRTAWQQLTYNSVVLVRLGVGVGVKLLHGGSAVELTILAVRGIRHCALTLQKHMTNISGSDCRYYNRLSFLWSNFFLL